MATMTYLVKISTTELTGIKTYEVSRNRLWSNANRNMAGALRATKIGTFPVLNLTFKPMSRSSMKALIALLDPAVLSVSYWDEASETYKTGNYYASDFKYSLMNKELSYYESASVSLIPYDKMT